MATVDGGPPAFSIATRRDRGVLVLAVRGEVDMVNAPALAPDFEAAVAAGGPVVVDLCGTSFMDSTALYALLVLRTRLEEAGRRLAVARWPDGAVGMLFRVSGTDRL